MYIFKRNLFAVLFILSSSTVYASPSIIHSIEFPPQPKEISTQTKPNTETKDCKNDKDCTILQTQTTAK